MLANASAPRPEFPRPQFDRGDAFWLNLNGVWAYGSGPLPEGAEGAPPPDAAFPERITVPFCRESRLSGIGDTGFCERVRYRRTFSVPAAWRGRRTLLHIGASDYLTRVWVNGTPVGSHAGGYASFSLEITGALRDGTNVLTLCVTDRTRSGEQPSGKQSMERDPHGCFYTRVTGVWQTVWLESVPSAYLVGARYVPDLARKRLALSAAVSGGEGLTLRAEASYRGVPMGEAAAAVRGGRASAEIPLDQLHLWEAGRGRLYDLTLTLGEDRVRSYFGMREVHGADGFLYLNGERVFQRLVLDQGFYPDGVYTAPSLAELEADIDRALAMGFNGARLHQKVFEPLFLSLCDRKGYLVWEEYASWGTDLSSGSACLRLLSEWIETLERDFNHPSIIGLCPLNETDGVREEFLRLAARVTRLCDGTRPYIDASGWTHLPGLGDLTDFHCYCQDPAEFRRILSVLRAPDPNGPPDAAEPPRGRPSPSATFASEYGGIYLAEPGAAGEGWGYGDPPASAEAFLDRFAGLTEALLSHPRVGGLCYTQLTDVEQERNGLYTYDRRPKADPALIRAALSRRAVCEGPPAGRGDAP